MNGVENIFDSYPVAGLDDLDSCCRNAALDPWWHQIDLSDAVVGFLEQMSGHVAARYQPRWFRAKGDVSRRRTSFLRSGTRGLSPSPVE